MLDLVDGAPAVTSGTEKGNLDFMVWLPFPPMGLTVDRSMRTGILVQTIAITAEKLQAHYIWRSNEPEHIAFTGTMPCVTLPVS